MNYIPIYKQAIDLCNKPNSCFYETKFILSDYKISTFNYRLASERDFNEPGSLELRGITFVFNNDGSLYKRFLMLKKFFNVNQVDETQFDVLKNKKIKNVTMKEDGSLIAFMQLPNGKVFAKTQAGFTNEQSVQAMNIYKANRNVYAFVNEMLCANYTPLFEYVAYDNRIVLKYSGRDLCFIGIRHNETGEYISAANTSVKGAFGIRVVNTMKATSLEDLNEYMKTTEDIEGVVVEFEDGQLVKWKTNWYTNLHGIRTMHIFREDYVIHNYLNETLDDATQELNMTDDADAFKFIERVKNATINWSNYIEEKVDELVAAYNFDFYFGHWAKFATDKHKSAFFGLARTKIERPETYKNKKIEYMLAKTRSLTDAKNIVEKYENTNFK